MTRYYLGLAKIPKVEAGEDVADVEHVAEETKNVASSGVEPRIEKHSYERISKRRWCTMELNKW